MGLVHEGSDLPGVVAEQRELLARLSAPDAIRAAMEGKHRLPPIPTAA